MEQETEDQEPKRRSLIPPPPSHPPPPRPARPPVIESVDAGEEREEQTAGEEDDELEIGDITLTEKTDEEQQEEGAESEGEEGKEYSYVRTESKERLDEASPSPENLGEEEDRPTSVMSAPDYENVTEDMLSHFDEDDAEKVKSYMNVRRSQVGDDEQDDTKRNSRPNSYLNMAPFPPDFKPAPSPEPDGSDATDSLPSTDPKPAPRKPKNRVPPPPPPNYKDILRQLSGSPSADVIPRPAVVSARTHGMDSSRPALNKLASSPAPSSTSPAAPAKPPRARHGRTPSDSSDKERGRTPMEPDQSSSPRSELRAASPDSIQRSPHRALVKSQSSDVLSPHKRSTPESSRRHLAARRAPLAPGNTPSEQQLAKKPVAARIARSKMVTKDQLPATSLARTDKSPAGSPRQRAPVRSAPPPPGGKKAADPSPVAARRKRAGEEATAADSAVRSNSPLLTKQSSEKKSEDEPVITEKVAKALEAMKSKAESIQSGLKQGQVLPIDGRVASPDTQASLTREFSNDVLSRMTIINVELQRVEGQSLGLHIAEGVAGTNKGHDMRGVFVKEIITGTPAWSSKKLCVQDVLVEIAGVSVLGSSLEDAARLLKGAGDTVRLKVGRTSDQAKTTSAAVPSPPSAPSSRMADDSELKEENKKLQEELSKLKQELLESEENAADLTQTVASVSVEKTKLEREAHKLRDQLSKLSSQSSDTDELATVRTKLKQAQNDKDSLEQDLESARTELKSLKSDHTSLQSDHKSLQNEHKSLQDDHKSLQSDHASAKTTIKQLTEKNDSLKAEVDELKEKLKKERELRESAENRLADAASLKQQEQKTKAAPPEAPPKPSPTATPRKDRSVSPSPSPTHEEPSEEPIEEAETTPSKEEEKPKDIKEEPASSEVKEESEKEEEEVTVSIAVEEVEKEEDDDTLSLDDVKSASRLDSSSALHKSQLTSQMRRKKPTREHVRSMATLSPFPEEMPRLSLEMEDEETRTAGAGGSVHTPKKPMKLPQPTPPKPKPRPQPMPRKKPSPEHTSSPTPDKSEDQKRPMPVPRTQRETTDKEEVDGGVDSPVAARKLASSSPAGSPKHSSPKHSSPAHSPKLPIKPPVATPEPTERRPTGDSKPAVPRKPAAKEESPEDEKEPRRPSGSTPKKLPKPLPPKPSPRPQKPDSSQATPDSSADGEKEATPPNTMADKLEAIKRKDPSELTVKEKMMLAQQAMAMQAEYKQKGLPPPIRKKKPLPKAMSVDSHDAEHHEEPAEEKSENSEEMDRSQSSDNIADTDSTPPRRPPKKLPPGAFNMAFPGLGGDPRRRSNTVASTGSSDGTDAREMSPARHFSASKPETSKSPSPTPESTPVRQPVVNNSPAHQIQEEEASQISNHSTPELSRKEAPHHGSTDMLESYADMDIDDEPPIPSTDVDTQATGAVPDKEQVLFWSPEVVGMWLGSLGLGSHASSFKEKEIKGWMLFDLDNSKLKKLGVSSGDDRNTFKKELKALKPFADKIKRDYDRKKREDKKRLEQEKKQAKKKK